MPIAMKVNWPHTVANDHRQRLGCACHCDYARTPGKMTKRARYVYLNEILYMIKNRLLFMKKVNVTASAIFSVWHRPLSLPIKHTQMWFKIQLINSNYKMDVDVGADLIRANHNSNNNKKYKAMARLSKYILSNRPRASRM